MKLMVTIFLLVLVAGCGREEKPATGISPDVPEIQSNSLQGVAVVIDGNPVTRDEICRRAKAELTLAMNKARRTKVGRNEVKHFEKYCKTGVKRAIQRATVARYIGERKLNISAEEIKRQTEVFTQRYGVKSKKLKRWHTVDDLKYILGRNAALVDEEIQAMARYVVATNDIVKSNPVVITEKMIQERVANIGRLNHEASATNRVVFALATNVWRKIVANEMTFEAAATNFSEDVYIAEGCEWGSFTMNQLEDETALLELLPTLKPGDITPPIESDGGLAIIRKDEDDDKTTYSFSRVFFRLPMFWDEETPAQARAYLFQEQTTKQINEVFKSYADKLKVEYPCGKDVIGKITAADFKK